MDIELKKLKYSIWFKVLAWVLCIGCALGAFAFSVQFRDGAGIVTDYYREYWQSRDFNKYLNEQELNVRYGYTEPSEEDVVDDYQVQMLESEQADFLMAIETRYAEDGDGVMSPELFEQKEKEKQDIQEKYAPLIAKAKEDALDKLKADWDETRKGYQGKIDTLFAVYKNGTLVKTNLGGDPQELFDQIPSELKMLTTSGEWEVTVGVAEETYQKMAVAYAQKKDQMLGALIGMCICLAVGLAAFIWLLIMAGRRPVGDGIVLCKADWPFLDVTLLVVIFAIRIFVSVFGYIMAWDWLPWVGFAILLNLCLYWVVCAAKRLKAHSFWKHTLIYWLWNKLWLSVQKTGLGWRVFWAAVGYVGFGVLVCTLIAPVLLSSHGDWRRQFLGFALIVVYFVGTGLGLMRPLTNIKKLNNGLAKIQGGDLNYRIEGCKGRTFEEMAGRINHMTDGFRTAVEREVKSERMKSQLITNVSHDLKTPLTSIITYVDLLKKEELSEKANQYVDILEKKSERLKQLTDTLFEAAKASGGDITPVMKPIELRQFLEQVLGETGDQIETAGLTVIPDLGERAVVVTADGALLWRVMGNLIGNACKYALKGSRVYLSLKEDDEVQIEMKNISAEPLNISEEELMERFVRGDSSRHSEGSGLGLSIAKSYMELMGGKFQIVIDGDLFKAVICMPKYR